VEQLEKKFMDICGTEAAIYMPSGTMANQLAVAVLSAGNPKIFVQDESHLFRDEADAAQLVFGKRLIPLAKGETYFTAKSLRETIERLPEEEVFHSGIGAVSIECPVRRMDGRMVPIAEIKAISDYCRSKAIPLHLDGARIHMAAAWSGISVKEYASYFDTIYISLYKYLSASGGAILCGRKPVIAKMPNLIKIHGGSMYANWTNAAMALNRLDGIENKIQQAKNQAVELIESLNKVKEIKITSLPGGTNVYNLKLAKTVDAARFRESLNKNYHIRIAPFNKQNETKIFINETILYQSTANLSDSFSKALKNS
jgi:threonine aldolase